MDETGNKLQRLLEHLESRDAGKRANAAQALAGMQNAEQAIPQLIRALGDEDLAVQANAALALANTGRKAVKPLLKAMSNWDAKVRANAIMALASMNEKPLEAIPALINALNDSDAEVQGIASTALEEIGMPAVRLLAEAVKKEKMFQLE